MSRRRPEGDAPAVRSSALAGGGLMGATARVIDVLGEPVEVGSGRWCRLWEDTPAALARALSAAERADPALTPLHPLAMTPAPLLRLRARRP